MTDTHKPSSHPASLVLIVDDNPRNLEVLSGALTGGGIEIAVASDGEMALELAAQDLPDLILLDIVMPGLSGFDVCERLKADPKTSDIPVIFMTAMSDTADKVKGLSLGAADYITKPFQHEEALARVKNQLKLQSLTRKLAQRNAALEEEVARHAATEAELAKLTRELERRIEERTIALTSAHADIERVSRELKSYNDRLEHEVRERTEDLSKMAERLKLELAERERAEKERVALQEEVILAQRERLAELSTPLIPITDRVVVMPLIGTMDEARTRELLEIALRGAKDSRAEVVIIDITGVKSLDREALDMLLKTAAALKLLGAQSVLTGIRPEVARALVDQAADLGGVLPLGTLKSGIAYALRHSRFKSSRSSFT